MSGAHGHGTTLATATYTNILNIISITGPNQTRDSIDISTMDSSAKFREFIPGLLDAGELTFDVNYDGRADAGNTGYSNTLNTILTASAETWTLTFPDTSTWACTGL